MTLPMKPVAIFLAKCIIFMIVYWLSYGIMFAPASDHQSATANTSAMRQEEANRQITEKYFEQLKQSELSLKKQKELLDRWEKIIEQWERSIPAPRK